MRINAPTPAQSPKSPTRLPTWVLHAALVGLVVFVGLGIYGLPRSSVALHLKMSANSGERGEIFYRSHDASFSQRDSIAFVIVDDDKVHDYVINLPVDKSIDRIRIDPAVRKGETTIYSLEVRDGSAVQTFDGRQLFDARGRVNQTRLEPGTHNELLLHSMGNDPYFEFSLHSPTRRPQPVLAVLPRLLIALAASLALAAVSVGVSRARTMRRGIDRCSGQKPGRLFDDELLQFTPGVFIAFGLIAVTALLFVALKLNQSSIGVWEKVYPNAPVEQQIDIGSARLIRTDEWKVHTPWILSQVLAGSPSVNHNIGGATAPLIASLPIADPIGLPNLKYAGFRFLGIERGYSWFWSYKSFGLAFSFLWLLLILTRGNLAASIIGMLWVYFSSYTQWWFSSGLPEIMTAFAFGTTGALYALYSTKRLMIGVGAALIVYAAANLALNLYPPFVVSLGYLAIAIVAGYGLEKGAFARFGRNKKFRFVTLAVAFAATAVYGAWFVQTASSAIESMLATAYPGSRVLSSGGVPTSKLMDGFFEAFRLGEDQFPRLPLSYNASEASGHLIMLPLLLLLVPFRRWFQSANALMTSVAGFCALAFAWTTVALPQPLNKAMQLAGWSAVTPKRTIMALGVGSILLSTILLSRMQTSPPSRNFRRLSWIAVPLVALAVAYFGWRLKQVDASFFSWQVITLGTLVSALIAFGITRGNAAFVAAGVAILALPAISVNPLTSGLSSIMEKPILQAARTQGGAPGDRWVAIGDNFFAQGLKAMGLNVIGGSNYLPDRSMLDRIDPHKRYAQVWNRYSTISVSSEPGIQAPRFELIHPDQYRIVIDVCSRTIQELGITHVAYTIEVPAADLKCLHPLDAPEGSGVRLFGVTTPPLATSAVSGVSPR
ncbi:MAG: DUF7657 domain-containing protein [Luteimonas sp.]